MVLWRTIFHLYILNDLSNEVVVLASLDVNFTEKLTVKKVPKMANFGQKVKGLALIKQVFDILVSL